MRPSTDGQAELTWVAGYIDVPYRELNPDTITQLSTNRARCRLSSLIETNALPLRQATDKLAASMVQTGRPDEMHNVVY